MPSALSLALPVLLTLLTALTGPAAANAARTISAHHVAVAPRIDGSIRDAAWETIPPTAVPDAVAKVDILLRAAYDAENIYFLVMYPDPAENAFHKPWVWDEAAGSYSEGPHREDTFVFKWNLEATPRDLSAFSEDDYRADIWYWKADRTNRAGYADDKFHVLRGPVASARLEGDGREENEGKKLTSAAGRTRYLVRKSDPGTSAYREVARPEVLSTPLVPRYQPRDPAGSRGDVRARGVWNSGFWFLEFARPLRTGHEEDVQFDPAAGPFLFGVSIYSLYGNPLDRSQPNLYGMGRISEPLELTFR